MPARSATLPDRNGLDPARQRRDRGPRDDRRGQRRDARKRLETRGLYVGSPARRVRDLTQQEIDFLTYSAAHYVKLKDEYLSAA